MELSAIELIGAGGDVSMMALFFLMWKFDRRLLKIEIKLKLR